ncbi:MAG TPA: nucleotidyltransferase domain-containing protein [Ignavibacteria bacterium]|nr:nucleotidyltransferase domain-containing protein [Ignavibacteria bacterium]
MNEKIQKFCKKWKINELSLFGSYITERFDSQSDIDVLIDYDLSLQYGFFELIEMKNELEDIYGREIDLLTRNGIEKSRNIFRKNSILNNLQRVYGK